MVLRVEMYHDCGDYHKILPRLRLNNLHAFSIWIGCNNIRTNHHTFAKTRVGLDHFVKDYMVPGYLFGR